MTAWEEIMSENAVDPNIDALEYYPGEPDDEAEECCSSCGKPYEDFSDMGCGRCDQRHPDWGLLP
jgi:hypothetical protein